MMRLFKKALAWPAVGPDLAVRGRGRKAREIVAAYLTDYERG
jgi:hypothetical protein